MLGIGHMCSEPWQNMCIGVVFLGPPMAACKECPAEDWQTKDLAFDRATRPQTEAELDLFHT